LNRLVPYYKLYGAKKGLHELRSYEKNSYAIKNALFYSIKAELFKDLGNDKETNKALQIAIELTKNKMQQRHLIKKQKALNKNSGL